MENITGISGRVFKKMSKFPKESLNQFSREKMKQFVI